MLNIIANTIRINMQAVTYFWHNTTNRMAFGDQLQDQRWIWGIGKIIANVTFTLDKIPLISNSFKVILFYEKEEFQTLWPILLIPIHALWMIFIYSSEVHAEKVWRQHIELSFLSSKQLLLLHRIHAYSIGDDSYPNPNSLSLSFSLSLSMLMLWFARILFFLLRFYKLDNTNSNVNVRNTACSIEYKNFYQHTVTRVARDRTRTMIIISALYCTIAVDFPMFPNLALSCSIWSISHQRRCIS